MMAVACVTKIGFFLRAITAAIICSFTLTAEDVTVWHQFVNQIRPPLGACEESKGFDNLKPSGRNFKKVFDAWRFIKNEKYAAAVAIAEELAKPSGDDYFIKIESALIYAAVGMREKTDAIINAIGRDNKSVRCQIYCAEGMGDSYFLSNSEADIESAIEWYRKASSQINSTSNYEGDLTEVGRVLAKKESQCRGILLARRHGTSFVLYQKANELRLRGDYRAAGILYAQLIDLYQSRVLKEGSQINKTLSEEVGPKPEIYKFAAAYYNQICRFNQETPAKFYEKVSQEQLAIIKSGPYYPDFCLLMFDACILGAKNDVGLALEWIDNCEKSISKLEAAPKDGFLIPDRSIDITKPAEVMKKSSGWGSQEWFSLRPEAVINIATCAWYSDYLKYECSMRKTFGNFILGKRDEALRNLEAIGKYDEGDYIAGKNGMPSTYSRLLAGIKSGGFFADDDELKLFSEKSKMKILYLDFIFEQEKWREWSMLRDVLVKSERLPSAETAYLDYCQIQMSAFQGRLNRKSTADAADKYLSTYPRSPFADKVKLLKVGTYSADQKLVEYQKIANQTRSPKVRSICLLKAAQIAYNKGKYKEAISIGEEIGATGISDGYRQCGKTIVSMSQRKLSLQIPSRP